MNKWEVGEIRRHIRRDRSNMTALYGCYVNDNKQVISEFHLSTGMMSENEGEKYFGLLKRCLSGRLGKNLIDIEFPTAQVASGEEHKLLMELRACGLKDDDLRHAFYDKVIQSVELKENYLILIGCDSYDVPMRKSDGEFDREGSGESYTFLLCAVCPVKQSQPKLHYIPENKEFHDGGIVNAVSAPEIGFLFPAFDNRSTNIYNALYYTHSAKESHDAFADAIFAARVPEPAEEQKKSFAALLSRSLEEECTMDAVQTVHDQLSQRIQLHKESRIPEPLTVTKEDVKDALASCGVSQQRVAKFGIDFEETFGFEAQVHPDNIINDKRIEIKTPDVSIKVAADRADLIQTRIIGGVKYILICAEEDVEVNGVSIHIRDEEGALL